MEASADIGQQLGRYRLLATLSQGGTGTNWLAVAGGLGAFRKLFVIKELRQDLARDQRFVEMFLAEAKLAARLNHPNVVQTLEAARQDDRYFLAMELLDGQPLGEVLQRAMKAPAISLGVRIRILCGALAGLHYAHELRDYDGTALGIVHHDLSPQNVFVTYDGQVKVVDFGIARAVENEAPPRSAGAVPRTDGSAQPSGFMGKLAYAAPEQLRGEPVDRRADVFAVGVLLWEAVAMRRFAKGPATQAALDARLSGTEPRLALVAAEADPALIAICDRAMNVDPAARFATADELRAALEQYLFASGERVEQATVAAALQEAFADERVAMQRMIDASLKDAAKAEAAAAYARSEAPGSSLAEGDPPAAADHSKPNGAGAPDAAVARRSLRARVGTALWIAAGVLFVGALAGQGLKARRAAHDTVISTPLPPRAMPVPSVVAPPSVSPPAVMAAPPTVTERAPRALVNHGEQAPAALGTVREPDGSAARVGRSRAQSPRDPASAVAAPVAGTIADDPPPAAIGEDLRKLRKLERRKLDLEDPFQ